MVPSPPTHLAVSPMQVKLHISDEDWLRKIELLESLHMVISSLRMTIPTLRKTYLLVTESFMHSIVTACLICSSWPPLLQCAYGLVLVHMHVASCIQHEPVWNAL